MRARIVTEVSCYLENKPGILGKLTSHLATANININGMQCYDGSLQSLVMLIVDQPDLAEKVMRDMQIELISMTDILQVDVSCKVGGLAEITTLLGKHQVNIKSIYLVDNHSISSTAYIRVDNVEQSLEVLNTLGAVPVNHPVARIPEHRAIGSHH